MTITGFQPSDAGQYSVAFTNECGTGFSIPAAVGVGGPCASDLNGDRSVDGADVAILLGAWGSADADLTGDGVVNGRDLGRLLADWGTCPN
jgi:hypothetical protein